MQFYQYTTTILEHEICRERMFKIIAKILLFKLMHVFAWFLVSRTKALTK